MNTESPWWAADKASICRNVERMLYVMDAWVRGNAVEMRDTRAEGSKWIECRGTPHWDWEQMDYRIKREPSTFYIADNRVFCHRSEAENCADGSRIIKVVEVVE